jgi:hypothetical protein
VYYNLFSKCFPYYLCTLLASNFVRSWIMYIGLKFYTHQLCVKKGTHFCCHVCFQVVTNSTRYHQWKICNSRYCRIPLDRKHPPDKNICTSLLCQVRYLSVSFKVSCIWWNFEGPEIKYLCSSLLLTIYLQNFRGLHAITSIQGDSRLHELNSGAFTWSHSQ